MHEQNSLQIVKDAYSTFKNGDIQSLLNLMAEDISWFLPGNPEVIPFAGRRQGIQQVREFFSTLSANQDFIRFEPREFIAQGDKVVALGSYEWRIKSSGRTYGCDFAHVFTVRDGKIGAFQEFYDTEVVANAFRSESAEAVGAQLK
jgi:ketosteroid isomerase-like protein